MEPDWNTVGVLGAARGARGPAGGAIGTQSLLVALTSGKGPAREALAGEGFTRTAAASLIRQRLEREKGQAWADAEPAEESVASTDLLGEHGDERDRFTGSAATALTAAMELAREEGAERLSSAHLLRALLGTGENHAAELLATCGTTPGAVLGRLNGGRAGLDDGLAPWLHPTRDVLLGRAQYRQMVFWKRWLTRGGGVNWASMPIEWITWETHAQARVLGHRTAGTEHALLAVLSTHEVATRYPHLAVEKAESVTDRFAGGERLSGRGVDYAAAREALGTGRLGPRADPRPVARYLEEAAGRTNVTQASQRSTGPLVEALLAEDTRARRLVEQVVSPADE